MKPNNPPKEQAKFFRACFTMNTYHNQLFYVIITLLPDLKKCAPKIIL